MVHDGQAAARRKVGATYLAETTVARRSGVKVLLVEDNPGDARLVSILLSEVSPNTFDISHAGRLGEAFEHLERSEFDVVLLDLSLPDSSGLEAVDAMQGVAPYLPLVVLSGMDDEQMALEAIQSGAEDYLVKGRGDGDLISRAIRYAIQRKKAEERLAYLSQYDSLTGLANRALFQDRLTQAVARAEREGEMVALLSLDLDRFKDFNDALGHGFGDMLLKTAANRLQGCVREGDTVARLGSDEFGIVLEDVPDVQFVASVAQRISAELTEPFTVHGQEMFLSAGMGIAVRPPSEADALIRDASAALQRAKAAGPDNYQFFSPEMNVEAFERLAFESSLRRALERGEFELHYQPQVDLSTGRIVGAEALLRWNHPELGLISPAKFIPVLEETGMILEIGAWVIQTACSQSRAWRDDGLPGIRVAVNLSAKQFEQQDLSAVVSGALEETGLSPDDLELEITESLLMQDSEESNAKLGRIKSERGVRVSIDDFGTGYSSLAYLKRFPIDALKVDQSFIRDLTEGSDDAAIVAAIIGLAHSLRLAVIAEGVETAAQLEYLRRQGCDEAQGYYLSRPVPAAGFATLLRDAGTFLDSSEAS
ncbi:MAG TPA: EAL domain-containing protein [Rubrobacteraceae bacterium]|nr:EAL domain-containing protein [Rubrobacteraceae bacterium]